MLSLSYFLACLAALAATPLYDIRETHDWLTMRDGTGSRSPTSPR